MGGTFLHLEAYLRDSQNLPFTDRQATSWQARINNETQRKENCMLQSYMPMRSAKMAAFKAPLTLFMGFIVTGAQLMAQVNLGPVKVGSSTSGNVTVSSVAAGRVSSVEVLTAGAPNRDYTDTSDTCSGMAFSALGQVCSVTVSFTPVAPGLRRGAVVLLDSSGNVLGSTLLQGTGTGGLAFFNPPGVSIVAGNGYWSVIDDGGPALEAGLYLPSAVALDGNGNLYVADSLHNLVRMVSSGKGETIHNSVTYPQDGYIVTIAGNGVAGWTGDGHAASDASVSVNDPSGLAIDGAGNLYIADTGNNVVRSIDAATGIITTIAGNGAAGDSGDNGLATKASFNAPAGVSVDAVGNLYIADTASQKIRAICGTGTTSLYGVSCGAVGNVISLAGDGYSTAIGVGGYTGDNGPATSAELNSPYAPGFDANGNMYIPDSANNVVRLVSPAGTITTFAGTGTPGYFGDGGLPTAAALQTPTSVIVDSAQNVLICDSGNSAIRKVNAVSGDISSEIANSFEFYTGSSIASIGLYGQKGIVLDDFGDLFVANTFNMRVLEFQANAAFLDFTANPIFEGNTSTSLDQTIENDGNDNLTLSSISEGANAAYQASSTTCINLSPLSVDAQCVIAAEFAPSSPGDPLIGTLTINGQAANTPMTLTIAGDSPSSNSTLLAITSTQNPVPYGQSLTISGSVSTGSGSGTPTGTLTFYDGAKVLKAAVPLNALASGSFAISTLAVGTHSITATYSGDSVHSSSTSNPIIQQVAEPTAVAVATSSNPAILGSTFTLTADVTTPSGGGVTPDGLVAFLDGTTVLGTASVNASGSAALKISSISQGPHSFTAQYGGDTLKFIDSSTSATLALNAVAPSSLSLSSSINPATFGVPVTLTATLKATGSISPTGSIVFSDGSQSIGTMTIGTGGVTAFPTNALAVGPHSITASYAGDQNVNGGNSTAVSQTISEANTVTALTVNPVQPESGTSATLTASVSPTSGSGVVTGMVTFSDGATKLGSSAVGANGKSSIAAIFSTGTHTLKATYAGDTDDSESASAVISLDVSPSATKVALTSGASPALVLGTVTFTATVSGTGAAPTGTIVFSIDGTSTQPMTIDGTETASFTTSSLAVGRHTIVANYSGDKDNLASSSTLNQAIGAIPTSTLLNTSNTGGSKPQAILIASVAAASSGPVPQGTITFSTGSTTLNTVTLDGAGIATFVPQLPPSTYSIVASYSGDSDHASSVSSPISIVGTLNNFAVTVTPSAITVVDGETGTLDITLTPATEFSDTIQMGCLGLPANALCLFSSQTVPLQNGKAATIQLVINSELIGNASSAGNSGGSTLGATFTIPGGFLGLLIWRRRLRSKGFLIALIALAVGVSATMSGCGSTVGFNKAAPGKYTVRIGGTGQNTGASFFQSISLTVQ